MKLADYLYRNHITPADFMRTLDLSSRETVRRYLRGERIPSPVILQRIIEITGGQVQLRDFLDKQPPKCAWFGRGQKMHLPWSRELTANDDGLSPAISLALETLGTRTQYLGGSRFELEGRPADARAVVTAANRLRRHRRQEPIRYPGVEC